MGRLRKIVVSTLVVALLSLGLLIPIATTSAAAAPAKMTYVAVPKVIGDSIPQACVILKTRHLDACHKSQVSGSGWKVTAQRPAPGVVVKEHSVVDLHIKPVGLIGEGGLSNVPVMVTTIEPGFKVPSYAEWEMTYSYQFDDSGCQYATTNPGLCPGLEEVWVGKGGFAGQDQAGWLLFAGGTSETGTTGPRPGAARFVWKVTYEDCVWDVSIVLVWDGVY
jgi:hypothetical protein